MAEGLLEREDPGAKLHELYYAGCDNAPYGAVNRDGTSRVDVFEETTVSEDEVHNSQIGYCYKKLVDPDSFEEDDAREECFEEPLCEEAAPEVAEPYGFYYAPEGKDRDAVRFPLENGARASSYLFHAESPVNRQFMNDSIVKTPTGPDFPGDIREETAVGVEEENEDLRPSATTIQYIDGVHSEDAVRERARTGFFASLTESKKRRLLLGGLCAVLFALVVVVIVNCAVISHLSRSLEAAGAEDRTVEASAEGYGAEEAVYEVYE